MIATIKEFLKHDSAAGVVLVLAALLAMVLANSPWAGYYNMSLNVPVEVRIGSFEIAKPFLLWINDGLMAIFFFLVGLELKRELLVGELSDRRNIVLPVIAAAGGMLMPALIYSVINWGDAVNMRGWAIPTATDIAFALGVLSLFGKRVPVSLKIFLVSLAIFDDLGAIIVIAVFYTSELSVTAMSVALTGVVFLCILNVRGVAETSSYLLVGLVIWAAVLKSGVHATIAGVVIAMFIPMRDKNNLERSPLQDLEHGLHATVGYGVLPLFAFANAGISLAGVGLSTALHPVPLGIAVSLFVGKQLGVFGFSWLGIKSGLARLPVDINWGALYGCSLLCGIGFTMSLFVGSLAFEESTGMRLFDQRLGIIIGSLLSALAGSLVLHQTLEKRLQ